MQYYVQVEGNVRVCRCDSCCYPLQMGTQRVVFCPMCEKTLNGGPMPDKVLCCAECDTILGVIEFNGLPRSTYCLGCGFTPSMQDTFFIPRPNR